MWDRDVGTGCFGSCGFHGGGSNLMPSWLSILGSLELFVGSFI